MQEGEQLDKVRRILNTTGEAQFILNEIIEHAGAGMVEDLPGLGDALVMHAGNIKDMCEEFKGEDDE